MKKIRLAAVLAAILVSVFIFTGCGNSILYGMWQMEETINAETGESSEPLFVSMMVFTVNRDGTIYMMDSLFGTFEKDGNEFVFTYDYDEGEEPESVYGAWELLGSDLYIYDNDEPYIYHLVAVTESEDEDTE